MSKGGKAQHDAARRARLSAALRENLRRRKAQALARTLQDGAQKDEAAAAGRNADAAPAPDFRRNQGRD
jgi:hypothetical protein